MMQREKENKRPIEYYQKACKLCRKKQWSQARVVLEQGLLHWEKPAVAHHLLGVVLYQQGHFQLALKELQKACNREQAAEYFLNLSLVFNELGQYEEGAKAYQQALHIYHQSDEKNWQDNIAQKHLDLATAYFEKQYFQLSLKEYTKTLKWDPANSRAHLGLIQSLWKIHKKDMAFQMLKKFIQHHSSNMKARLLLAEWYFETQQIPQAVNEWEKVLYEDPANTKAREALLQIQDIHH